MNHYSTKFVRLKDFSVCGHSCGQSRFCAAFGNRGKSRKRRCCKALRRFALPRPGYRHGTPKPGAIPTSLYPDIQFLPLYHGGEKNQRFSCLWSFMWSKPILYRFRQSWKSRKRRCRKALRHFALPCPGYRHGTPKASALPTALIPAIQRSIKNLAAHYFYSTEIWWKVKRKLPEMILMMKIMNAAKVNTDTTIAKPSSM